MIAADLSGAISPRLEEKPPLPIAPLRRAVFRFFADDTANALTEFAVVLAVLSVGCMLYFGQVSTAATTRVTSDTAGFTNTAASPP